MRTIVSLTVACLVFGAIGEATAAAVHLVTWVPRSAPPGTRVTIAGTPHELTRMPIRDLGGPNRYALSFLASDPAGSFGFASVLTRHTTDTIENPISIDGFDASVDVSDSRSYLIRSDGAQNIFSVMAIGQCVVNIKVGKTLITLSTSLSAEQQPDTDIGTTPNAVPFAAWDDYIHPTALVNGCDRWLDYIRISPLN
jgi:hypothetical protein